MPSLATASCHLLWIYGLLLVYGTWFPLADWDWSAGGIRRFMAMDVFAHMSRSDSIINLAIYMPFGFLAAHRLSGSESRRLITITLLGGLVSAGLEFGQTFLPTRFPSLADIILNTTGTLLGALVAVGCHRRLSQNREKSGLPLTGKAAQSTGRGKS